MPIIYVTYAGEAQTRFDREYYVRKHLPLVMDAWAKYGLQSVAAFFPMGDGAGTIAICECRFRDEDAIGQAFASSETKAVMDDIGNFTDVAPSRSRAIAL